MFGHPKGLKTLFFTELWERMSFYGMKAILMLFLVDSIENGGFGITEKTAGAIWGIYTSMVYLCALPGGWIADRILGLRQSVFLGGILIMMGHFSMAIESQYTFYAGLVLIVIGTGLLKPNISALVGELYPEGGGRRDAGFSIYYMGINLGALLGALICGYLGEKVAWHWGFGTAGVGMMLGLLQYRLGLKDLDVKDGENVDRIVIQRGNWSDISHIEPSVRDASIRQLIFALVGVIGITTLVATLQVMNVITLTVVGMGKGLGILIAVVFALYFAYHLIIGTWSLQEKKRIGAIFILILAAAIFFSGFEQAGSSLNLFAKYMMNRSIGGWEFSLLGWQISVPTWEYPASWLQSVNPFFIVILAPIFAWLWVWLRHREPSIPVKFGIALILMGIGFFVIAWGSIYTTGSNEGAKVSSAWLIVTYWLHTSGELCLSPVGLSSVTKLSPKALVGQMMGMWFAGSSLGNLIAGLSGGLFKSFPLPKLFVIVATVAAIAGVLMILFKEPIKKLCGNMK